MYTSEYAGEDISYAVDELVVFVKAHMSCFIGCSYLVFMWDPVNCMLVVFGEEEHGELSQGQVELVFLAGQKMLEEESPRFDLLEEMTEEVRDKVFDAVKQHFVELKPDLKICYLFDRSSFREDYEVILG